MGDVIDARVMFELSRVAAKAQRELTVDMDQLEADLRTCMVTGQGFDPLSRDGLLVAPAPYRKPGTPDGIRTIGELIAEAEAERNK